MNEEINIIDVNESDFNEQVIEASEKKLVLVDFWAPWCEPCKQLSPTLEKIANENEDKVLLAKINIDENQQVASQLRIQSIPTVFAFKDKKILNAFQGVLPEKKIIEFIEKAIGEKLEENFTEFFIEIENNLNEKNFSSAKDSLEDFIANKPKDPKAISLYILCLIGLNEIDEAENFLNSLDKEILKNTDVQSSVQRLTITKNNLSGPSIERLLKKLASKPNDVDIICQVADKYFSSEEYEKAFNLLIDNYPKNKQKYKIKIIELFNALGHTHEKTIEYRKKLSQIMFC